MTFLLQSYEKHVIGGHMSPPALRGVGILMLLSEFAVWCGPLPAEHVCWTLYWETVQDESFCASNSDKILINEMIYTSLGFVQLALAVTYAHLQNKPKTPALNFFESSRFLSNSRVAMVL